MSKADQVKEQMTDTTLEDELSTVLAGTDPLQNLSVAQTGPLHYTVLSARNGGVTAHRVNIQTLRCSCKDMEFNKNLSSEDSGGREICAHIAYALLQHPQMTVDEQAIYKSMGLMEEAATLKDQLDMQLERFEEALVELRDAEAAPSTDTGSQADSGGDSQSSQQSVANAQDKADELQAAFDGVLEDMQVQASAGHVWFKTGRDTEEDWPYPGSFDGPDFMTEVERAITSPDLVKYVHDGSAEWADTPHSLNDDKPGEYWKNALDPDDVDEYISEVLE